jgi:GxxExxY protein
MYKGAALDAQYRIDLLVEDLVVVEVKSVDRLLSVHQAQVLTYMA